MSIINLTNFSLYSLLWHKRLEFFFKFIIFCIYILNTPNIYKKTVKLSFYSIIVKKKKKRNTHFVFTKKEKNKSVLPPLNGHFCQAKTCPPKQYRKRAREMFHFGLIVLKLVSDGRVSVGNLADILLLFCCCCCWVVAGYIYKPSAGASHSKRVTSMLLVVTTHALWSIIDWAFHLYTGPPCLSTAAESGACSLVK